MSPIPVAPMARVNCQTIFLVIYIIIKNKKTLFFFYRLNFTLKILKIQFNILVRKMGAETLLSL